MNSHKINIIASRKELVMTTNQLKYFVTAAKCLNFTEAGKVHFISQTAITQHIQALEEQLNVKLFTRKKRRVELTPAGKVFLEEARAILERTRLAVEKTEKAAQGETGTLNIGYVKGYENSQFGRIIKKYKEHYPNIVFGLYRKAHLDLLMQLDKKKIDVAFNICYSDTNIDGYEIKKLGAQRLYAVLYPSHPYANLTSIHRYDLRNDDFFLNKFYDDKSAKSYDMPEMFAKSGFFPHVIGSSSDLETIMLLVAAGIGISIMPEHAIRYVRQCSDLVFIPLEGEHEYLNTVAMWKEENDNPALHRFLEILNEFDL